MIQPEGPFTLNSPASKTELQSLRIWIIVNCNHIMALLSVSSVLMWTLCLTLLLGYGTALTLPSYELIHNVTTTGSALLQCREETTTSRKLLNVTNVIFRENSTDADLRERDDVIVIETDDRLGIVFNLTRNLEGSYTCERRTDSNCVPCESPPITLICELQCVSGFTVSHI